MTNRDHFEARRAEDARQWLNAPERKAEEAADRSQRAQRDIVLGHLPTCSLTRCATNCPSR